MGQTKQFEDMDVWQAAKQVVLEVYRLTRDGALAKDYGFKEQLQRAAVSIMANIADGYERGGNRELIQFLYIAKGSAAETRSLVHAGKDLGYLSGEQPARLLDELISIGRQLGGFIRYLEKGPPPPLRGGGESRPKMEEERHSRQPPFREGGARPA
jgi:four helix bundle protein